VLSTNITNPLCSTLCSFEIVVPASAGAQLPPSQVCSPAAGQPATCILHLAVAQQVGRVRAAKLARCTEAPWWHMLRSGGVQWSGRCGGTCRAAGGISTPAGRCGPDNSAAQGEATINTHSHDSDMRFGNDPRQCSVFAGGFCHRGQQRHCTLTVELALGAHSDQSRRVKADGARAKHCVEEGGSAEPTDMSDTKYV